MKRLISLISATLIITQLFSVSVFAEVASPSKAKVLVNQKEIGFQSYAINGNTYFKLRDLDVALDGTTAGFKTVYDKNKQAIVITKGAAYISGAKISNSESSGNKTAQLNNQKVIVGNKESNLEAYNIDGYSYFKLRDMGNILGFEIGWDNNKKVITITAKKDLVSYDIQWENGQTKTCLATAIFQVPKFGDQEYVNLCFEGDNGLVNVIYKYVPTESGVTFDKIDRNPTAQDDITTNFNEEYAEVENWYKNTIEPAIASLIN